LAGEVKNSEKEQNTEKLKIIGFQKYYVLKNSAETTWQRCKKSEAIGDLIIN